MAKDSLAKASSPEPFSRSKTSNWVARGGGLPAYIQHIAHDLMEKRGKSESQAIQMAIGIVKNWASGKGNVDANTRAAAAKAVAQWEALKAKAKAGKLRESPADLDIDALDAYALTDAERTFADAYDPPALVESPLTMPVEVGDLSLLEATAGQSLSQRAQTRSGSSTDFNTKHPRGRGGSFTIKQGASGEDVRTVQRRVGAKADGSFGAMTKQAVMEFQRKHGLQVDGQVGHQTATALAGHYDAAKTAKVGALKGSDRAKLRALRKPPKVRESAVAGALALRLDSDMRLVVDDNAIRESFDLAVVDGHGAMALTEAATTPDALFNDDGTIDFVLIRPSNGRGIGNRIYEADMLREHAHVFSNVPMYDSHESDEARRARKGLPRPPSELAGEVREARWDPSFATPQDDAMGFGRGAVIGRCILTEDMEKLVRRLPGAVKTSINAQATSLRPGIRNGKRGMLVEGIRHDPENMSVDLVTKAGAGGQVAALYRGMARAA